MTPTPLDLGFLQTVWENLTSWFSWPNLTTWFLIIFRGLMILIVLKVIYNSITAAQQNVRLMALCYVTVSGERPTLTRGTDMTHTSCRDTHLGVGSSSPRGLLPQAVKLTRVSGRAALHGIQLLSFGKVTRTYAHMHIGSALTPIPMQRAKL